MNDSAVVLTKEEIKIFLAELMKERTVFAPASNGKKLDYLPVANVSDVVFGDALPYKSPKEIFFPRSEKIITFKGGEAVAEITEEKFVLFGAKPCDLEAIEILRKIFTEGKFRDPFFETRYENTLIIGISCFEKKPGCFCDLRETDLGFSDKCDLFFRISENADSDDCIYEVLYVSDKGREALVSLIPGLSGFVNAHQKAELPKTLSIETTEEELFGKIDWGKISQTCQGCGMCTFICPTCHCFLFKDVDEGDSACRYRNWDSCMFPKFTLHASGHNPRTERHERYRQRIAHKYLYLNKNFGVTSCTGCGRCVRGCPAGLNIKSIAEGIAEDLK